MTLRRSAWWPPCRHPFGLLLGLAASLTCSYRQTWGPLAPPGFTWSLLRAQTRPPPLWPGCGGLRPAPAGAPPRRPALPAPCPPRSRGPGSAFRGPALSAPPLLPLPWRPSGWVPTASPGACRPLQYGPWYLSSRALPLAPQGSPPRAPPLAPASTPGRESRHRPAWHPSWACPCCRASFAYCIGPPPGAAPQPPRAWRLAASAVLAPAPGLFIERGPSCSMAFPAMCLATRR